MVRFVPTQSPLYLTEQLEIYGYTEYIYNERWTMLRAHSLYPVRRKQGFVAIWIIHPKFMLNANLVNSRFPLFLSRPIISTVYTQHDSITVALCANLQNDWVTKMDVMD